MAVVSTQEQQLTPPNQEESTESQDIIMATRSRSSNVSVSTSSANSDRHLSPADSTEDTRPSSCVGADSSKSNQRQSQCESALSGHEFLAGSDAPSPTSDSVVTPDIVPSTNDDTASTNNTNNTILNRASTVQNEVELRIPSLDKKELDIGTENTNVDMSNFCFNFDLMDNHEIADDRPVAMTDGVNICELSTNMVLYQDDQHCPDLMRKLRCQMVENIFCDVELLLQGKSYHAHKCVLVVNSSYFHSVLAQVESTSLDLTSLVSSVDAFGSILEFMYTGNLSVSMSLVKDLLSTSQHLGTAGVKKCCDFHVNKNISLENWEFVSKLCDSYQLESSGKHLLNFFCTNFPLLYKTKTFLELESDKLLAILEHWEHNKVDQIEHDKLDMILHWVVHDYKNREPIYCKLMKLVHAELFPKRSIEMLFSQPIVRTHPIFQHGSTAEFLSMAKDILHGNFLEETGHLPKRRPRKPAKPTKLLTPVSGKRGRLRKQNVVDDGMKESTASAAPVVVLPRKRGRPSKQDLVQKRKHLRVVSISAEVKKEKAPSEPIPETIKPASHTACTVSSGKFESSERKTLTRARRMMYQKHLRVVISKGRKRTKIPLSIESLECTTCDKKFVSRRKLTRHMHTHMEKTICCELCVYRTTRTSKLKEHICRIHPEEAVKRGFLDESVLENRKQKQDVKQKKASSPRPPKKKPQVAEEDMVQCPKCPRKFPTANMLYHHMKGHGTDTPYLCEICGFSTKHFSSINVHKRQHNGKKFTCTHPGCDYSTIRRSRLEDHVNTHQGIKNHVCSVCGKAFASRKHMQRHEKVHVEIKPFSCDHCDYRSVRRDKLNDHLRKHHPSVAIIMGILDPSKVSPKPDTDKKPKPSRPCKPRQKKVKLAASALPQASSLLGDQTAEPSLVNDTPSDIKDMSPSSYSGRGLGQTESDQASNYVTMPVPQHLLGASTINEEMIQYLASMTSGGLVTSHPQIQIAPVSNVSISVQSGPQAFPSQFMQSSVAQTQSVVSMTETLSRDLQAPTDQRSDTWVYHIVPENQQF